MRRFIFWLLVATNVLTLPVMLIALFSPTLFSHLSGIPIFTRAYNVADHSLVYEWEQRFWINGATPHGVDRHHALIAALQGDPAATNPGEFIVAGHRLVSGNGAVFAIRKFRFRPQTVVAGANSQYEKITVFLPDGLPKEGESIIFGGSDSNGPFAVLTFGGPSGGHEGPSCFAYARRGAMKIVESDWEHDRELEERLSLSNDEGENLAAISETQAVVANISLEFEPYRWEGNSGPIPCGYFPVTPHYQISWAGRIDQIWFHGKGINELEPWEGAATGPLEMDEFVPKQARDVSLQFSGK